MELATKKQEFVENVGYITENSVNVKFNDDLNWPIEYIRFDNAVYSNPDKVRDQLLSISHNVQKALSMGRRLEKVSDHGPHIDPFIIKYHPAWISIRRQFGFTHESDGEVQCTKSDCAEKYENQIRDGFISLGIGVDYGRRVKRDALLSTKVFNELFPEETVAKLIGDTANNHPDFNAFRDVYIEKLRIEFYQNQRAQGVKEQDVAFSYKGVGWTLGPDTFPLLTIGSNKSRKTYDFRNSKAKAIFYKKLADKNPKTEFGKAFHKAIKTARY